MFSYFLCVTILFPILLAMLFSINKNSLLQRGAVFFMAAALFFCSGWAIMLGKAAYQPTGALTAILENLLLAGNAAAIVGAAYWSRRSKDWVQGSLTMIQGSLLGWFLWQNGAVTGSSSFALDHLAMLILLLVDGVGAIILVFSIKYMETHGRRSMKKNRQPQFFAAFTLLLGATNGLILANHLLWVLFFWQAVAWSAFSLIALDRTALALKTAKQFAATCSLGIVAFLCGILLLFPVTGTLLLSEILIYKDATQLFVPLACLVVAGLALAGQFPFQSALVRSTTSLVPVSAMLQSSSIVAAGVYLILRLSPVFMNTGLAKFVALIGAFNFASASLLAAMGRDTKRILTLTTISSSGLVIALACFPEIQAIYAAGLLIVLHGFSKALIFLSIGSHSPSSLPGLLTVLGGITMLMPPFGVPLAQWTALEASVRTPAALGLIIAGIVFSMIAWTRFLGKRMSGAFNSTGGSTWNSFAHVPQLALAFGVIALSICIVPIANHFVAPVIKENYGRFGDIAQGDGTAFIVSDFSGVNPLLTFGALGVIFILGWVGVRLFSPREVALETHLPDEIAEDIFAEIAAETLRELESRIEKDPQETATDSTSDNYLESGTGMGAEREIMVDAVAIEEQAGSEKISTAQAADNAADDAGAQQGPMEENLDKAVRAPGLAPRCSIFAAFPDERKTYFQATVIAGGLIILMLEVVFR